MTNTPLWIIQNRYADTSLRDLNNAIASLEGIVRKEGVDRSQYRFELADLKAARTARWTR